MKEKRGTERERDVRYQKERTNISISSVCPVPADQVTRLLCMGVAQRFRMWKLWQDTMVVRGVVV